MTYLDIETLLARHDADLDAAEAHGIATGMLCLDDRISPAKWQTELFQQSPALSEAEQALLRQFFVDTRRALAADSFEFNLFLPDDDLLLSRQLEAVSNWCRGFLLGVGFRTSTASWPGDSGEILKDIIEFTKMETQVHGEEDEQALVEIIEYLRAAIMLLRDDLRGSQHQLH